MNPPIIERATCCCVAGHRPGRLPSGWKREPAACSPVRSALRRAVVQAAQEGYRTFLSGMALGVDTWAAEEVLALRDEGWPVRLVAALPCPGQDSRWSPGDRRTYRDLLRLADAVYTVSPAYAPYCMGARNRWMIERASRLIAVYDGGPGGTADTVRLAEKRGLSIVKIDPLHPEGSPPVSEPHDTFGAFLRFSK